MNSKHQKTTTPLEKAKTTLHYVLFTLNQLISNIDYYHISDIEDKKAKEMLQDIADSGNILMDKIIKTKNHLQTYIKK